MGAIMQEPTITDQLIAAHGLKPDEYQRILDLLGREPSYTELGIFSAMWNEHCSYKSSKKWLRTLPTTGPQVICGPGENAGVVDIGDGQAVVFKMESHNHPSYIEPFQGAATGVGGILRDVFTMGARPIAAMDALSFGRPEHPKTAHLVKGVVEGIGAYGNAFGVPGITVDTHFGRLARRFGWNPTLLRIVFVLVSVLSAAFPGILVYLIAWLLIPVLAFGVDDTLDPRRFAMFPRSAKELQPGMFAAAALSLPTLLTVVAVGIATVFEVIWLLAFGAGAVWVALALIVLLPANLAGIALCLLSGHWWLLLAGLYTTALAAVCGFAQNALRLPPPGTFFLVMVGGGSVMLARTDVTVGQLLFWALTGMVASLVLGMAPALIDSHGPERRAVAALEKAAAAFKDDRDDSLARHHQAQTALFAAWQALSDARIIRGGRIIDSQGAHLVERTLAAQHTIVAHNRALDLGADSDQLTDNVTDVDPDRTAIPHTRPTGRYRLYRAAVRDSHAMVTTQKVVLSAAITVLVGLTLGFDRPDWGVVSAFLMLQWGPDHVPGTVRGIHRMLGSVVGVLLFSILHYFGIQGWTLLLALAACQFCAEIFVAKNYAICVIFSTPLALLMGNSATRPLWPTIQARCGEIVLSILIATAVLWLWQRSAPVRNQARLQVRAMESMATLLGLLFVNTPDAVLSARRDLQYELLSERRAIQSLAVDNPDAVRQFWARHIAVQHAGYFLLDFCTTHPDRTATRAELDSLVHEVRAARAA